MSDVPKDNTIQQHIPLSETKQNENVEQKQNQYGDFKVRCIYVSRPQCIQRPKISLLIL